MSPRSGMEAFALPSWLCQVYTVLVQGDSTSFRTHPCLSAGAALEGTDLPRSGNGIDEVARPHGTPLGPGRVLWAMNQ